MKHISIYRIKGYVLILHRSEDDICGNFTHGVYLYREWRKCDAI